MFIFQYRLCHEWLNSWCKNTYWQSKSGNTGQWMFSSKSVLGLIHKYCVLTPNAIYLTHSCVSAEPLVYLQWDDDGGEHNAGCVQPRSAVRRGGRWPWRYGMTAWLTFYCIIFQFSAGQLSLVVDIWWQISSCSIFRAVLLVSLCFLEALMRKDLSCKYTLFVFRTVCSI